MQDAWVGLRELQGSLQSRLLTRMLSDGASVDMQEPLKELLGYTDWEQAAERGRIVPHAGSDAKFDAAEHQVQGISSSTTVCMCALQQMQQEDSLGGCSHFAHQWCCTELSHAPEDDFTQRRCMA